MTDIDELVSAWVAWSQRSADPATIARLEAATQAVGGPLGLTPTALRIAILDLMRGGRSIGEAVDQISAGGGQPALPSVGKGASGPVASGEGDPTAPAEPIIRPAACAYCLRGEHHLCRPDRDRCNCARNGHEIDVPRSSGSGVSVSPPACSHVDRGDKTPAARSTEGRRNEDAAVA